MNCKLVILLVCFLAAMIARPVAADYIWHDDEIPYHPKAACPRGHSYYSNSISANDTDIDISSEIESLLEYSNRDICFYCVCSTSGADAGCINRSPWFCEYYRFLKTPTASRDMYRNTFQQDRPTYFRQLSYRLRRTMDDGMYDFIQSVGNGLEQTRCVPFVSQYTDCTDESKCPGCTKCSCTAEGQWSCENIKECDEEDTPDEEIDDQIIENAMKAVEYEMKSKRINEAKSSNTPLVPAPRILVEKDDLLEYKVDDPMEDIMDMIRQKRSADKESDAKTNDTVKFYGVVDEFNEDTLKTSNGSGTLQAHKVDIVPNMSRRTGVLENSTTSLQIEFSEPNRFSHITDNKIDTSGHNEVIIDVSREKLHEVLGNHTQETKDKELSKLVVNELNKGSEIIGDSVAPVISNITFTPENDTFTAMAYIAGNLLNKLWNIEKDASGTSIETEMIKHEKIANLLDLFKEPLSLKQELFLKNALAQLSNAIDKTKDIKNISICEKIEEVKKILDESSGESSDVSFTGNKNENSSCKKATRKKQVGEQAQDAITKVNKVMTLIQKFDGIKNKLISLQKDQGSDVSVTEKPLPPGFKRLTSDGVFTVDEKKSINQFKILLGQITGVLNPKNKPNMIHNKLNTYGTNEDIKSKFRNVFNIDLGNLTVTAKDKLIFDYLNHIEANPECLLSTNKKPKSKSLVNIEGNILLNLSEFFKMKSFSDLFKLMEPKNEKTFQKVATTSENPIKTTTIIEKVFKNGNLKESKKFENTKDKLKAHLRTILEDLIEIQNAKGVNAKADAQLMDALPCIYNILNADKELTANRTTKVGPSDKVIKIFNELITDLKIAQTRRSGTTMSKPRPKSAVVWERTIKDLNKKTKPLTRRNFQSKTPKSLEDIKKIIDKIESGGSNTYKQYALLIEVPAAEKLVLLKTLATDVEKYINALEEIKLTISNMDKLPADKQLELTEFLNNVATNINLNGKIINGMNKPKERRYFVNELNSSRNIVKGRSKKPALRADVGTKESNNNDMSVSRDLIINQLIRNRVELYMKLKESKGVELDNDMNYIIAQKILIFLDSGNYKLARELYKVFVTQKQNNLNRNSDDTRYSGTNVLKIKEDVSYVPIHQKQPLIQFEESKPQESTLKWLTNDQLIKQLLNIKTMNG